jgi:starch synthase
MEILLITPEMAPYSGTGPDRAQGDLAQVTAALAKALRSLDHRVTVVCPLYAGIDPTARHLARRLTKLEFELEGTPHACELYDGRTSGGVDLLFIGHEELFHKSHAMAEANEDEATVARRVRAFSAAVAELVEKREPRFDVLHAHGWVGGAVLLALGDHGQASFPRVLTIHEVEETGRFDPATVQRFELDPAGKSTIGDHASLLAGGMRVADRVTTVSSSFAQELRDSGGELAPVFGEVGERLTGIQNGVDVAVWNPATDSHLKARFDRTDLSGKARCKAHLQELLGFPVRNDVPLFGVVGTASESEGLDLLARCGARFLRNDVQVAIQLDGDDPLFDVFEELSDRWPDRLQVRSGREPDLAHRIVGGSDFTVVPARRAPSGFLQMYAHRYGSVPVVRRTGGLADTVIDCDPELKTGTGFVFDEATAEDLLAALQRATAGFTKGKAFRQLRHRVIRIDHSWERSARLYERLYRDLAE